MSYIDSFDPKNEPCTVRVELGTMPVLSGVQPGLAGPTTVVDNVSATSD